jgi:hypothetical protein
MASAAVIPRHLIIWRDPPVWPFVWPGLLPLCALVAVVLFAAGPFARLAIQSTVERELRGQLDAAGFGWVGLAVSGQSVKLAGVEPQSGAGAQALQLARAASCPTWLGRRTCAARVSAQFMPAAEPASVAAVASRAPELAAAVTTRQGCEQSLASSLAAEQIAFAPGSAKIDAQSGARSTRSPARCALPGQDPHRGPHRHRRARPCQPAPERGTGRGGAQRPHRPRRSRRSPQRQGLRGAPADRR